MDEKDQKKLDKLNARYKRQNEKIQRDYDRISAVLPKGSTDRIKALGMTTNQFINELVVAELNRLESEGETANQKPKKTEPNELNGKPVYKPCKEEQYIASGQWWHDVVFFWDDLELNDLFIKLLDSEAEKNHNFKDGCRNLFDLIDIARTTSKYSDEELSCMSDEEVDRIQESELAPIDQTEKLKDYLRRFLYEGDEQALLNFIGVE